jgi:hypothetical protein
MSTARLGVHAGPLVAGPWCPGIMKIHVGVTLEDLCLIFREIWQIRARLAGIAADLASEIPQAVPFRGGTL